MTQSRYMSIAIIVSVVWHLFWLFGITIVDNRYGAVEKTEAKISFLGPLLDKTFFEMMIVRQQSHYAELKKDFYIPNTFSTKELRLKRPEKGPSRQMHAININKEVRRSIREIISGMKARPFYDFTPYEEMPKVSERSYEIAGPAQGRALVFVPAKPLVEKMAESGKVGREKFTTEVRFFVSSDGKVVMAEPMVSCGYPDVDIIAVRFVKNWVFSPALGADEPINDRSVWGQVKITLGQEI